MFTNCWWWSILGDKCSLFGGYMIIIWVEWYLSRVFGIHLQIHQKTLAWVRTPPFLAMPRFSRLLLPKSLPKSNRPKEPPAGSRGPKGFWYSIKILNIKAVIITDQQIDKALIHLHSKLLSASLFINKLIRTHILTPKIRVSSPSSCSITEESPVLRC